MWIFNSHKTEGPRTYHFAIGAVKIAEIKFRRANTNKRWLCDLWLLDKDGVLCIDSTHLTMSAALSQLHNKLNSPPKEHD